jgi:hypothetical protein
MSCNNVNVEPTIIGGGDGSTAYDAFGRLRVSNPLTIFDSKNIMSKNNLFDELLSGSGTVSYTAVKSTVNLNVTEVSGDKVIRQSKRVMSYQPGKSLLNLNTFVMNTLTANLKQKIGMFDSLNGIFFYADGTTLKIVRRTYVTGSPADTEISQSSWNGDKLDGTGASGYTLDPTKATILFMDFEWLGMGSVRVGFVIDGKFIVAHTFYNANSLSTVYMQTANLPIRYEIETAATLAAGTYTLQQVCSTCMSEGGYAPSGLQHLVHCGSIASGVNLITADTFYNLATIRIKSGRPYAVIVPSGIDILNIANADFEWAIYFNATPSSPFSYTSYDDNVEYDLTTTTFSSLPKEVASGYLGGKTAPSTFGGADFINWAYQLGQTIGGTSDTLTLAARAGSNNSAVAAQLKWLDLT